MGRKKIEMPVKMHYYKKVSRTKMHRQSIWAVGWVMAGKEGKPACTPFRDPIGICLFNRF